MALRWIGTGYGGLEVLELIEYEAPRPGPGEVTIKVRAAGMNPADYKGLSGYRTGQDPTKLPTLIGFEVAGVLTAIGDETEIASGGGAVGDEVLAFRVRGGYSSALTVPAKDVFAKPASLSFPEAANLLLAGSTASDMLRITRVGAGDTVLLHGASGAVGVSAIQQARMLGARVIGTASEKSFDIVRGFGGEPVAYGEGLEDRVLDAAPDGIDVALDAVGTDEAIDVSLSLVADRSRIVTIAAQQRAEQDGFAASGGTDSGSARYRDEMRARLVEWAGAGDLVVPVAQTFPLTDAIAALELLQTGHAGGKLALIP